MNIPSTVHRGAPGAGRQAWRLSPIGLAICLLGLHGATRALPQGGQVVQGQAGIQTKTPGQMDIHQSTDKAIINWQGFSIDQGEVVRVQQPGANAVLLNRVTGVDPSLIEGRLQANGQVFLLNPRGVVFGKGSQIDAGGFMASTLGLSDTQFMAGQYALSAGERAPGALQADGRISAPGGTVALVAPQLSVGGRIDARRVGLAAAGGALVDVEGDGLVLFNVRTDQLDTRLSFTGTVQADGGSAELRAQARAGFADTVLNMDGVVQARSLGQREGRIVIDGGSAGITRISGTLDARGQNTGEQGGSIAVLGQKVGLFDHALLDASGAAGGGTALVGGNFHGAGAEHNAERTYLGADAIVRADALTLGNGGQVAVWSDQRTDVYGHISARGGALGGQGGAVETSGKRALNMPTGGVDVSAPQGRAGSWLLDPNDITIVDGDATLDNNISPTNPFDSTGNVATLSTTTLNNALSSGATVTVTTQSAAGGGPSGLGDITVSGTVAPVASNATLNLVAQHSIAFTSTGNILASGANLTVNLKAGTDVGASNTPGTNASTIRQDPGSVIDTGGGALAATAKGDIQFSTVTAGSLTVNSLGGSIGQTSTAPAQHLSVAGATVLDAGAGSITLTQAANDFQGAISLTGATSQVTDTNALTLATVNSGDLTLISGGTLNLGRGTVTGTLNANSQGGSLTQSSTLPADHLSVLGVTTLDAGAGNITLAQAGNDFQGTLSLTGASSQVRDANALTLGTLSTGNLVLTSGGALNLGQGMVAGTLNATSNGGTIGQRTTLPADHLSVSGGTVLNAGAGNINLSQTGNALGGTTSLTGATISVRASGTLSVTALSQTAADQALALQADTLQLPGAFIADTGTANLSLKSLVGALSTTGPLAGQDVTLQGGAGLGLNSAVTARGQLTLLSANGPITQTAALNVAGPTVVNAGSGNITLTQPGNTLAQAVSLSGANTQIASSGALTLGTLATGNLNATAHGALNLGQGTVAGTLNATSNGGTIGQRTTLPAEHLSVSGGAVFNAGAGDINLSQTGNAFGGTTSLSGAAIVVKAGGTLDVIALSQTAADQALALQADTLQLPGAFIADTGTANLSLKSLVGALSTTGPVAGQDVTLQGGAGLGLGGAVTARGQLTLLSANGPITQTAALNVAGPTSVNAGIGDITLTQSGNTLAQAVSLSGASTQIASSGALTLGTLATGNLDATAHGTLNLGHGSVGGTLNANSNGHAIVQAAGGLDVAGVATLTAGLGSITLTDVANNFHAVVDLSGAGTQITDANALTLGALATGNLLASAGGALSLGQGVVAGTLDANSHGGNLTQSAALTVTGATTLQAGAGSIVLTQGANDFQGLVNLNNAASAQISNAHALSLGSLSTGSLNVTAAGVLNLGQGSVNGTLDANSGGSPITQTGGLNVTGTASLNAGAGSISLNDAANHFQGTVNLNGGSTLITDINALTLGSLATGSLVASATGALNLGQGTVAGTLAANSHGGPISQGGGGLVVGGVTRLDAGGGNITLTNPANDFQAPIKLIGAVSQVRDTNALSLGTWSGTSLTATANGPLNLGAGSATAALNASSNGGDITQAGALTVAGTSEFNAGSGAITLTQAGNDFGGAVALSGGTTQIVDANALTLATLATGGLTATASGVLSLGHGRVAGSLNATSQGNPITEGSGGLTVTGLATVTAGVGTVVLTDAANDFQAAVNLTGSALQITSAHALTLGPVNTGSLAAGATGALNLGSGTVSGDLSANSHGGDITQAAGALTVGGNTTLAAGTGSITLANAGNDFQGAVNLSGGSVHLVDANALTLGTLAVGNLGVTAQGVLDLGQGTVSGTLTADSHGQAITQASGGLRVSGVTTVSAGAGSITLNQAANQFQATVNLGGGNTQLANAGALTLGAVNTGSLSLAAAGDLNLGGGSVGGTLDASSQGSALTQAGALTVAGATTVTADGHALQVTLDQAANQFGGGVLLAGSHGGAVATATVQSNQALAIAGAAGTLNASSGGLLTLGAGQYASLNATAVGGVAQSGALSVSGTATLAANGGAGASMTLTNAGNDLHAVQLVAQNGGSVGTVRLVDGDGQRADGLLVGGQAADLGITSGGPLTLAAGSFGSLAADTSAHGAAITQSGAISVVGSTLLNSGAGDIGLNLAGNDLSSLNVVATRAASVQDANDLVVLASQASQQLALSAPGTIHLAGPVTGTGALVMNGSGTLLIQGSQAYTGGTQALAGTVVLDGTAAQAGNGGTVVLGAGGRLDLRNGATLANAVLSQGGNLANTVGAGTATGSLTLAADTTVQVAAGAAGLTLAGAIGDAGNHHGLALGGGGVLTLAGRNDYSGATQVHAGTLVAQGSGALPSGSAVVVDSGARLQLAQAQSVGSLAGGGQVDLQGFDLSTGLDNTSTGFSGNLTGSGGLTKQGNGIFTLSGQNTASGATVVQGGHLVLAGGAALADSSAVTVAAGATLQLTASETVGSLAGAGTVDLQGLRLSAGGNHQSTEFAGALTGSGGLSKQGLGTLRLSGASNYTGETLVQGGTLSLAQPQALPAATAVSVSAGAALDLQSDLQMAALAGAGQVLLNSHTLSTGAGGADSQFSGGLSGSGGLVKLGRGNLALSGSNTYTGATTVSAGSLTLSGGTALADQTAVTVATGARLVVSGDETVGSLAGTGDVALTGHGLATGANGSSTRFDGVISGDGGLAKVGVGSMTLGGANTYSGGTQILAGTLRVGDGGTHGQLGSGGVDNRAALVFDRSDAVSVDNAISGSGSLELLQGQLTLTNAANQYTGATTITGGTLATSGAERLPDGSAVHVGAGGRLTLAGNETVASLNADGAVTAAGDLRTVGDQVYAGTLTLTNPQGTQLSAAQITANHAGNQFGPGMLSISAHTAQITAAQDLALGDLSLAQGGQITADRLALNGALALGGGTLGLTATATPDTAKATQLGNAQVPVAGKALAVAEATVLQGAGGSIDVASGASLNVVASGGGSVLLAQDANRFAGSLSVLSGPQFNTAWQPNVQGSVGVQSLVDVAGSLVAVGGAGIEADRVHIRADQLSTGATAQIAARLPFDEFLLGTSLSAPSMTLELAPAAFQQAGSFGQNGGQEVRVAVGSQDIGGRSDGLNAGYLTIRPKNGAQGATAVFLVGPKVSTLVGGYRFFHDGAGQQTEVPVFYNGVLPMTPQVTGALSSIDGDAEDARRARFQETVRTENVTIRLRAGVIAEVGPGRPATQGSDGAKPPEACEPAAGKGLACP